MGVPGAGAAVVAVEDLDEAHAFFDESSRRQALLAERLGDVFVEPVGLAGGFGFGFELQHFRDGRLHAEGELVALDAGAKAGVVGILHGCKPVEPLDELEVGDLLFVIDVLTGRNERDWRRLADVQAHAVVLWAEIVGAVSCGAAAAVGERGAEHDELREVVVERAEAVMNP